MFSLPFVQTKLANLATEKINKNLGTHIVISKIDLSLLGHVQLKGIEIRDHHKDTLIFVGKLTASLLSAREIIKDNRVSLGNATISNAHFYMKKYRGEEEDNLSVFLDKVDSDTIPKDSSKKSFVLHSDAIRIKNLTFKLIDANKKEPLQFAAYSIGGRLRDFFIDGPNVSANIDRLHFTENRGITITNLSSEFSYTRKQMKFDTTVLETNNASKIKADIIFRYRRKDLKRFTDKAKVTAQFTKSSLSVRDLNKLYKELKGKDILYFTGKFRGVLNNFSIKDLKLRSKDGMEIKGDLGFLNSLNTERGLVFDANLDRLKSNYNQLKNVLPNIIGKSVPSEFKKIGNFMLSGLIRVTPDQMEATLNVKSEIGTTISDLQLTDIDNIDTAKYSGEIEFKDFDVGAFAENPQLGKVSLRADVNGSGFSLDNINTTIIGKISTLEFKGYTYQNLHVNGEFENKKFDGLLNVQDENFRLDFRGLADFSTEVSKFNFTADIDKVNLYKTNLFTRDSLSVLKGSVKLDISGNTIDDIFGNATFTNFMYTNQKKSYPFNKFQVSSTILDSVRTIKVNSDDIVRGELKGKFQFKELLPVAQNALGSIYTNYSPHVVAPNQFIDFNFKIYNQIVDIFFPEVSIGKKTIVKGKIRSDDNYVKLTFSSPKIQAYKNSVDNMLLRMDNKNPLYNTHLTADKIHTKYYDVHKLNLLNRTVNDTLFFKSVFKGGVKQSESFNLDFYYTINKDRKSVVGIQQSTFDYQGFDWMINPKKDRNNKVTFDLKTKEFLFSPLTLVSGAQKIVFKGFVKDTVHKNLETKFTDVQLASFLPKVDSLALKGAVNGTISMQQENVFITPSGNLVINDFYMNNHLQGDLTMKVKGNNSYKKYNVDVSLEKENIKHITANGILDFYGEEPSINMGVFLRKYRLEALSPLGGTVLSNMRGSVSGSFSAKGKMKNPDFNGMLTLEKSGLTFPYLNIDFDLIDSTNIGLKNQSFVFDNVILQDTKHNTKGVLSGNITHQNFTQWFLNLGIKTNNLLVLDTEEEDEVPYYGTGFIDGEAKITGLTSNLTIDVNGKTKPGTIFVIPLSDIKTIDNYKLIYFKNDENQDVRKKEGRVIDDIKGLNLNINLAVTKDAIAQVVIDKVSGSELKGSGTGNLQIEINTRGKFNMYGDFAVDNGVYNFKYGGIINKPFIVQKGGTIAWNGNPYEAELNLVALYQTKANPAQLLDNFQTNRKIPIDLYTEITGSLFNSKQDFDIKLPNVNSTIASELEFKLNDNDTNSKMRQFFSLLVTGSFFSEETIGVSATSGLTGTASDLVTNILTDVLNTGDTKFQVGVGYTQGDKSDVLNLNTDNQVDVSVTTQLSDRIIVNGKVGVPVGAKTQTSVVGEVKVEVLLNEPGNLRATVFNRQNEVQSFVEGEEQGYTQGVGLSYQVNFDTFSDLLEKTGIKKKKKSLIDIQKRDSLIKSNPRINFKKTNKK